MTPEEHRARAERLIADAEQTYLSLHRDVSAEAIPDDTAWRFLDTTIRLAHAHAALTTPPAKPSFEAPHDRIAGLRTEVVHYGDDEPTYDRR